MTLLFSFAGRCQCCNVCKNRGIIMSNLNMYQCKYCGKSDPSKSRLLSLKCQSHPKGQWQGVHVLDPGAEVLADTLNEYDETTRLLDRIAEIKAEEQQQIKANGPYANVRFLANVNLTQFVSWLLNNWDSEAVQTMKLNLLFAFTIARDIKIPAGEIDASWAQLFSVIQADIEKKEFWQKIYWLTKVEYDLKDLPCGQTPKTLEHEDVREFAKNIMNNQKDENIRKILRGFSYGFEIFSDRSLATIIDRSWKDFFDDMEFKVLGDKLWKELYWICNVEIDCG